MANIKNFGLSGISADVQFGKAGGRVVYDAGNSVFKVTQADGSTLDNIRVATTPLNANDAASKAYVDSKSSSDSAAVQAELDATQVGAGLGTDGSYSANGSANYIATSTSLKDADNDLDAALKSEETARISADNTLQGNIDAEESRALAAESDLQDAIDAEVLRATNAENALDGRLDIVEGGAEVEGSIAKAEADAKAYTDARETAITTAYQSYADQAEADAKAYADSLANAQNQLSELNDVTLTSTANGDFLVYNGTSGKWVNVDVDTDTIEEGSSNLYWTEARGDANFASNLAASDTSDLAEGTNLYFTEARARASISVTDNGGDGSLSYNSTTGVITYTGPSAAEVRAHFSGGTGVTITDGVVAIGQDVGTSANVTFASVTTTGNVTVGGALTVAGDATFLANITGNTMGMTGDLTVTGNTNLKQLTTVTSLATKAAGSSEVNVFQVVSADATNNKLFEVRQNGDAIIGGTLTVNGGSAALNGNLTTSGNATVDGNLDVNGSLTVAGDATFSANIYGNNMTLSGNLIVGDADTDYVEFNADVKSDFIPDADSTYDLGTTAKRWANVYADNFVGGDASFGNISLTGGITGLTLNGLDDVQITSVAANQVIAWDGSKWVNVDNVNVNGSLTVSGDINAEANIVLNSDVTGAPTENAIIRVERGTSADVEIKWNETADRWEITNDGTTYHAMVNSAGTGVAINTDGVVSIGQAVGTTDNVTFNNVTVNGTLFSNDITAADVTISGNLIVSGTTTTVNTETIALADNTIVLNSNATGAATQNAGIEVERGSDANVSLVWDEANDRWTVGSDTFVAGAFIGELTGNVTGNLTGDVTGTVSSIANHTTDALAEGSTNLYYTDGRVAAYLTTNAYATEAYTDAAVADKNSFVVRGTIGTSGSIGSIVNVAGHTYYVSRITVKVTSAYDATVSISDGTNTLMTAAEIEEDVVGTYVAELPFATATAAGATISLVSAATAGAALVTVEYVQL